MDLAEQLITSAKRNPYFHLTGYMERYWLMPFNPEAKTNIRIHHILSSDKDRHFHDHPWPSTSIILKGGYWEKLPGRQDQPPSLDETDFVTVWRKPGDVITRDASTRHSIILPEGQTAWSMFIMGEYEQKWGFYTTEGKVYWRQYLNDWTTETSSDVVEGVYN